MKFLIAFTEIETLLKSAGVTRPKTAEVLTISACAARVFVEFRGDVAGIELIALSEGAVTLPAQKFLMLIKTYKGTRNLNFEGGPTSLKIQNFTMPILAWNPNPKPPANFKLFPSSSLPDVDTASRRSTT
ncbi:MAG: hypothetical protein WCH98_01125 [Verrucomicrobiota bacterium]